MNYVRTWDRCSKSLWEKLQQNRYKEFCRLKIYPRKLRDIFYSIGGSMLLHRGEVWPLAEKLRCKIGTAEFYYLEGLQVRKENRMRNEKDKVILVLN